MKIEITEAVWMDERQEYTLADIVNFSGLPEAEVVQLVEYATLGPSEFAGPQATFGADCLTLARTACRLRDDFDLDAGALALTLTLLNRIRELESQLRSLHAQIPRRLQP
jgi:chaperone modulatory protein CbpM